MQTILVTGGAGFIGSHVCEALLREGYSIICIDDFNNFYDPRQKERNVASLLKNKNFKLHREDIRNFAALQKIFSQHKIDKILHLAARAGVRPSVADPKLYAEVNISGTLNLLQLTREHKIPQFIFGSSSSVYGLNKKIPFAETDLLEHPVSPYAISKIAGEQYCKIFANLFGIKMTVLRFFTVYGPRGRPDMAVYKFTKAIAEGKPIEVYGDGKTKRDYTYVADIVAGIMAAVKKEFDFEIINLGDSNPVELNYLISLIEENVGKKASIKQIPEQQGDVPITYADISKAKRLLGYKPGVKIEEGIRRFGEWYEKQ